MLLKTKLPKLFSVTLNVLLQSFFSKKSTKKNKIFPQNAWYDAECKLLKSSIKQSHPEIRSNLQKEYKQTIQRKKSQHQQKALEEIQNCKDSTKMWKLLKDLKHDAKQPSGEIPIHPKDMYCAFSKLANNTKTDVTPTNALKAPINNTELLSNLKTHHS